MRRPSAQPKGAFGTLARGGFLGTWTPWAVAVFGAVLSLVAARHVILQERAAFFSDFEQRSRERLEAIEHHLDDSLRHVEATAALFHASVEVSRDEFRVFTRSLLRDDVSLQALGYNPVVRREDRRRHEQAARREGLVDYGITEIGPDGRLVPAAERDIYVVGSFLEPRNGNEAALGYDVFSEPLRRQALLRARDSGEASITQRLRLVQQRDDQAGALICMPIYRGGPRPTTVEERRRRLQGFAVGVLRIGDVVERALADLGSTGIELRLEDVEAPPARRLLHLHHPPSTGRPGSGSLLRGDGGEAVTRSYDFAIAGRRWSLRATPTAGYRASMRTWTPLGTALAGLLLTSLLVGYMYWQATVSGRLRRAIRERDAAEEKRSSFGRVLDESHDEIYVFDAETLKFLHVNRGARENLGYTSGELAELTPLELKPEFDHESFAELLRPLRSGQRDRVDFTTHHRRKDGSTYDVEVHLQLTTFDSRPAFVAVILDISERKALDERIRQSQRLEALGRLAGGIAHDFNNLLTSIIGYTELALAELPADSPARTRLEEVLGASARAKEVIQGILAFSRRGPIERRVFDLREPVRDALRLVRVSLPPTIAIHEELGGPCPVAGDPTQIHQVLMNLATNAGHAMRDGAGVLEVRLTTEELDRADANRIGDLDAGSYARLSVADSGHGIPPELLGKIFDPFFTTKDRGEGTGMGLAVAHGIVRSHRGQLTARSEPGQGSTFEVLLPRSAEPPGGDDDAIDVRTVGRESILVVDDEPSISTLLRQLLERKGYRVEALVNGHSALDAVRARPDAFDLVMTDLSMPGMSGDELARRLEQIDPGMPVILISGHADPATTGPPVPGNVRMWLTKPVTVQELTAAVRRVLDTARAAGSGKSMDR